MNHLNWNDICLFLAVAEKGTLTAAARFLGYTQPTLGRRIQSLEHNLGMKLFQRTQDGFLLTEAGQALFPAAKRMAEEADAAMRKLAGQESILTGTLRVSSFDWFSQYVLSDYFTNFLKLHPQVCIELLNENRLLSLTRREVDLVFRLQPFDEPDIAQRKLMQLDYALYSHVGFDLNLLNFPEKLTLITMDSYFSDLADVTWIKEQFPGATIAFKSNSREAQAKLCVSGVGLAVLPIKMANKIPGLQKLPIDTKFLSRQIWLGYHQDLRNQRRLRSFIEFISQ